MGSPPDKQDYHDGAFDVMSGRPTRGIEDRVSVLGRGKAIVRRASPLEPQCIIMLSVRMGSLQRVPTALRDSPWTHESR